MKWIGYIFSILFFLNLSSCSKEEDCKEVKLAIHEMYVEPLKNPYLTDSQRRDLELAREKRLEEACK